MKKKKRPRYPKKKLQDIGLIQPRGAGEKVEHPARVKHRRSKSKK